MFDNHCGSLQLRWCLCMQNVDKSSNMRLLDRFTLNTTKALQTFISLLGKPNENGGRRYRFETLALRSLVWKIGFWPLLCFALDLSLIAEMRGRCCQSLIYCCSRWYFNTACQAVWHTVCVTLYSIYSIQCYSAGCQAVWHTVCVTLYTYYYLQQSVLLYRLPGCVTMYTHHYPENAIHDNTGTESLYVHD